MTLTRTGCGLVVALLSTAVMVSAQGRKTVDPALLAISKTGTVLHSPGVTAIFWGAEWNDPAFAGDTISGLDTLFAGYSASTYAGTATEYYDRSGSITAFAPYLGHVIDASTAPSPGGLTSSVAIAEVCRVTGDRPDPSAIYVVFTSTDHGTSSCAFHTSGTCNRNKSAIPVQVAAVPYASGVAGTGCDALQDAETGHSLALAQMANIAMHEVVETITDPRGTGWRDGFGEEISDKCMRIFPSSFSEFPVFSNGSVWKLQAQWSNAAYLANGGAPNESGQPGCVW